MVYDLSGYSQILLPFNKELLYPLHWEATTSAKNNFAFICNRPLEQSVLEPKWGIGELPCGNIFW